MKIASLQINSKEKRGKLSVIVNHSYFIKNKGDSITYSKKTVVDIKKPTKKEIIKSTKKNI